MDKGFIRVSQFNVEGVVNKKPLLINFLLENDIDICLLNETWLKVNSHFRIPNYNLINQIGKEKEGRGGVAILIKDAFKYTAVDVPYYDFLQSVAINLQTGIGNLCILCLYCPPPKEGRSRFRANALKQIIQRLPKPLMLAGDVNAHHIAFGCASCNSRGNEVYNVLDDCDLCILNSGAPTTVGRSVHNPSAIDITCISPSVAPLCDWKVHDDPMGSYHYPTITDIQTSVDKYQMSDPVHRYIYSKADWHKFNLQTERMSDYIHFDSSDPISVYDNFYIHLTNIRDLCIPKVVKTTPHLQKKPVPWWDDECSSVVKKSKQALNFYRSHPSIENYITYKKLDAAKKKTLCEKKKNGWKSLCESFNRFTPISMIWNYMKKFKRLSIQKLPKNDEWIPSFFNKYAPPSPPEKNIDNTLLQQYFSQIGHSKAAFLSQPFSMEEFDIALQSRRNTTPGLDEIPYELIRHLHDNAKHLLLKIFNLLWREQAIPESWKTQCVIPIIKPDKPPNDCNSYRPISLASCIGKIFECMLKIRLDHYVESNNILPNEQFGFRKGRSAAESFTSFVSEIRNSFHSHSSTACVFLDVQGAFDNVNPSILIGILSDIGVPGHVCKWIFNFLYNRTMYVKFNNILHGPKHVFKGTMQGATISPLLYNLYTSQINQYLKQTDVKFLQFADDLLIYTVNRNVNIAVHSLNVALTEIHHFYCNKLKLNISPSKSGAMIFSKKYDVCNSVIYFNNSPLPWIQDKKFLGVCLDRKLTFENHINLLIKSSTKALNILRSLAGVNWGSDPKILSMLYKSLVRSHFDYSSLAYMNCNVTLLKKLDIIQNKALRIITGAMCSTPINAMQCESCIPPLILRRIQLASNFCLKLISSDNKSVMDRILPPQSFQMSSTPPPKISGSELISGHTPELLRIAMNIYELSINIYKAKPWPLYKTNFVILVNKPYNILRDKINNQMELNQLMENKSYYKLYTDGSKSENGVTSAFYDPQLQMVKSHKIDNNSSIFTAESYAMLLALQHIKNIYISSDILILTDSKSLLMALDNNSQRYNLNYIIYNIRKIVYEISQLTGKIINFLWVPSHCGITGNEIVDCAARNGFDADHSSLMKIPHTDYQAAITHDLKRLWHEYWNIASTQKGKWYATIQGSPPAKPWYTYKNENIDNRKFITILNRLRFGHCHIPTHLNRLNLIPSAACSHCNEEPAADLEHLFMKCRKFGLQRLVMVSDLQAASDSVPQSLQDLLRDFKFFKALYTFVVTTIGTL